MVPADFQVGDRVEITALGLRGRTGTISRPARLLWKRGWLVELDGGNWALKRTRVAQTSLRHAGR